MAPSETRQRPDRGPRSRGLPPLVVLALACSDRSAESEDLDPGSSDPSAFDAVAAEPWLPPPTARRGCSFLSEEVTVADVKALFDVGPQEEITCERAAGLFERVVRAEFDRRLPDEDLVRDNQVQRASMHWGDLWSEDRCLTCRDDASCERVRGLGAGTDHTEPFPGCDPVAPHRRFYRPFEYRCFLEVAFGDRDPSAPCLGAEDAHPTWRQLLTHLYVSENGIQNLRRTDLDPMDPLDGQPFTRATLHWESEANRRLFELLPKLATGEDIDPYQQLVPVDALAPILGCRPAGEGSGESLHDGFHRFVSEGLGLDRTMADLLAAQLAGPQDGVVANLGCVDTVVPRELTRDEAREHFGLSAYLDGQVRCYCGQCESARQPSYYRWDGPISARAEETEPTGDEAPTCAEVAVFVRSLVGTADTHRWSPPVERWNGSWEWIPSRPEGERPPTLAEVQDFLLMVGNVLPDLDADPFIDLVPYSHIDALRATGGFSTNPELDFQERVFDHVLDELCYE